jgi:hypothetical protein
MQSAHWKLLNEQLNFERHRHYKMMAEKRENFLLTLGKKVYETLTTLSTLKSLHEARYEKIHTKNDMLQKRLETEQMRLEELINLSDP